jgi:hypothetical protein
LSWFRRDEPVHARLAREGGLWLEIDDRPPHDPTPRWGEVGIHGVARPREWDAVVTADAPHLGVGQLEFVVLPDGTLVVDDALELEPGALDPLAAALETQLPRPYRASAVWRGGSSWGVAGRRIEVVDLPADVAGDEIVLSVAEDERSLTVDGEASRRRLPELEKLGAARGESFVVLAQRLADLAWEIEVSVL